MKRFIIKKIAVGNRDRMRPRRSFCHLRNKRTKSYISEQGVCVEPNLSKENNLKWH